MKENLELLALEMVAYKRFQIQLFDFGTFGIGGRNRKFDCIKTE